jgi:hypothetical protein
LNTLDLKKILLPESNEVDDVNKANSNETVYASDPLPVTDTSTDTRENMFAKLHHSQIIIDLNTLVQLCKSEWQSDCDSLSTSALIALFTCCWMSFEAVLGNTDSVNTSTGNQCSILG